MKHLVGQVQQQQPLHVALIPHPVAHALSPCRIGQDMSHAHAARSGVNMSQTHAALRRSHRCISRVRVCSCACVTANVGGLIH
jgi:hypothetical protein